MVAASSISLWATAPRLIPRSVNPAEAPGWRWWTVVMPHKKISLGRTIASLFDASFPLIKADLKFQMFEISSTRNRP
jgi:hypothetical protein